MKPIYLDYNATTPVDPSVLKAMLPFFNEEFGNASSRQHSMGCRAAKAVERARGQVAAAIGADPREIVFTSGATEACNLALKGVARSAAYARRGRRIVTALTEHKAVLDACSALEREGCEVVRLRVGRDGLVDLGELERALAKDTLLVSLMHANNETGVLHPVPEVGRLCRDKGVLFHTDATQSVGREPVDVDEACVDLLSLSAHKIYGAKGVGALYVRRKRPRVRLRPQIDGGGHESGRRSGTLNVPGIASLGAAAQLAESLRESERERLANLRDRLQGELLELPGAELNGHPSRRLANTLNVSFRGVDAEALMKSLPELALSSASACTTATLQPSHVLGAMGRDDESIQGSVRISLGRFTTDEEIDAASTLLKNALRQARR